MGMARQRVRQDIRMIRIRPALAALALSLPLCAQSGLVVNEVATGALDWIEIANLGTSTVNLNGYRLYAAWGTTTLATSNNTLFGAVTLAPGQTLVVTETANLSTPTTPAGVTKVYSGYAIGFGTTGTGTVSGCASLVNPSGVSVDLVSWGSASNASFLFGGTFTGTPYQPTAGNVGRVGNTDTNASADWFAASTVTPGALNPGQFNPANQILLSIASTAGSFSLNVTTITPVPFGEIYNLVSLVDLIPDGSGPVFGVGIDAINTALAPADPFNPFHTFLDAAGTYSLAVPPGTIPPGIHVEIVSLLVGGGGIARTSTVQSLTF